MLILYVFDPMKGLLFSMKKYFVVAITSMLMIVVPAVPAQASIRNMSTSECVTNPVNQAVPLIGFELWKARNC